MARSVLVQRFKKNPATLIANREGTGLELAFWLPRHKVADGGFFVYSSTVIDTTV